ncbi:MAG TPA: pyridoxal-phosphate dependent enzyme [Moraxellaceae bacterium]
MTATPDFLADFLATPTRLQPLRGEPWAGRVFMKREDERDALLGGNKWCKLAGHLAAASALGQRRLLSVGGMWSNHLHALAHAGQRYGFATTALVRGEAMTPMLQEAVAAGMQIEFVAREEYRQRGEAQWQAAVARRHGAYFIPEGGAGVAGQQGVNALAQEICQQLPDDGQPLYLAVPVGSGTTLSGLRAALPQRIHLLGFPAFADAALHRQLATLAPLHDTLGMRQHRVLPAVLREFQQDFEQAQGIPLDPVYTVRMMQRLSLMLAELPGKVVALHTGGLQGRRGHLLPQAA